MGYLKKADWIRSRIITTISLLSSNLFIYMICSIKVNTDSYMRVIQFLDYQLYSMGSQN